MARLFGRLDVDALEASIGKICGRHEVLRSTFLERQERAVANRRKDWSQLERLDLRPCAKASERMPRFNGMHGNCYASRSILKRPHLLRAQLLRLDEDDHALVIKLHHLVTDGWSQRLFWKELEALYCG